MGRPISKAVQINSVAFSADRCCRERKALGWTSEHMARMAGIAQAEVSAVEADREHYWRWCITKAIQAERKLRWGSRK